MNPDADLLSQLRDIHVPPPVGWWPAAPGWWMLAAALIAIAVSAISAIRNARRSPRRAALAELDRLRLSHRRNPQPNTLAAGLSSLLRRYALARFPGEQVGGLTGDRWLEFLNRNGGGAELTAEAERALLTEPYQRDTSFEVEALIAPVESWIKKARRPDRKHRWRKHD